MSHEDELMELLKEGAETALKTNEEESTVGVTHQYDKPKDREEDAPNALQGEFDGRDTATREDAVHHSDAVWDESKKVRQGVLERSLDSKSTADKADQAVMAQHFKNVASGNFEAHSPLLQQKSNLKLSHVRTPTLMERVRKVTGRQ